MLHHTFSGFEFQIVRKDRKPLEGNVNRPGLQATNLRWLTRKKQSERAVCKFSACHRGLRKVFAGIQVTLANHAT